MISKLLGELIENQRRTTEILERLRSEVEHFEAEQAKARPFDKPIYTEAQAAQLIGCNRKSLWQMRRNGDIEYFRPIGVLGSRVFYTPQHLIDWLNRRKARKTNR